MNDRKEGKYIYQPCATSREQISYCSLTGTHFRTYKEARIMTRGDRDIIIKRLTEEVHIIFISVYFHNCLLV